MPRPFTLLDSVSTPEGPLELRQRGGEFLISIAGRVLMSSAIHRTEDAVATLAIARMRTTPRPHVVIGGLGLGHTLRAALDALPPDARVTVAELNPRVVDWCRGPAAPAAGHALADPRVEVVVSDVIAYLRTQRGLSAVVVDLYEGPRALPPGTKDPIYGHRAIDVVVGALGPGGVYAVWSEESYPPFEARLRGHGMRVERVLAGRGGPRHAVILATRGNDVMSAPGPSAPRGPRAR